MSGKFSGRCSSSWVGSVLPGLPVWGAHPDLCSLWGQKHHLPPTLANASRAARHRQSHLVFSPQASFSFLYIQLCVERTVCNRQYRPVKCLKWRISGNLSSALLISGTDSNKTEGKGVGGSRPPELTAVGPWVSFPQAAPLSPYSPTGLGGWSPSAPFPGPPLSRVTCSTLRTIAHFCQSGFPVWEMKVPKRHQDTTLISFLSLSLTSYLGYPFFGLYRFFIFLINKVW